MRAVIVGSMAAAAAMAMDVIDVPSFGAGQGRKTNTVDARGPTTDADTRQVRRAKARAAVKGRTHGD